MKTSASIYRSPLLLLPLLLLCAASLAMAETPVVRVGVYQNAPLVLINDDGLPDGLFVDLFEEIARREGWRPEHVEGSWAECLEWGSEGKVDLITSVMHLEHREEFLDFHRETVLSTWGQVYVHEDSDIQSILDLQRQSVGMLRNGANGEDFMELAQQFGVECEFHEFDTYLDVANAVASGEVAAGVFVNVHAYEYEKTHALKQTQIIFDPSSLKFATAKGTNAEVLAVIDSYLKQWKTDRDSPYYQVRDRWLGLPEKQVFPPWMYQLIFAGTTLLVIAIAGVFILRHQVGIRTKMLRASQELLEAQFENSPDAILLIDTAHEILKINRVESPGLVVEELIGKNAVSLLPQEHQVAVREVVDRCFATGVRQELDHAVQGGRWMHARMVPIPHGDDVPQVLIISTDITDQRQAEEHKKQLITRLESQNAELERFTYTVSHDLKSPLITIKGYLGLLQENANSANTAAMNEDIARIARAANSMDRLLKDVLELSRIGRVINVPEETSVAELAAEAVELVGGQIRERGVRVEIAPDLPTVFADRTRLVEVLQNLIDNSVKYMDGQPQGLVEIGSRQEQGQTVFFVRDNGIGIDPRYHENVFGLFNQLDQSIEGSGVGLALAKRIVETHDGRIWVESDGEGCGATFCFTLPEASSPDEILVGES